MTEFSVQLGDVLDVPSDMLLLKHAQHFFGADKAVAGRLVSEGLCSEEDLRVKSGDFVIIDTKGAIAPKRVMFLGTPPLHDFTYDEMREFAQKAIGKLASLDLRINTLTTTVHGTGYGLDGGESLQQLVNGFNDGLKKWIQFPIEKVIFVTLGKRAKRMLTATLDTMLTGALGPMATVVDRGKQMLTAAFGPMATVVNSGYRKKIKRSSVQSEEETDEFSTAALLKQDQPQKSLDIETITPAEKKRVFVAMPFSEDFQNVYEFGIYPAVRNCGLICERVDETHFTGDILKRIRKGIESASLVIADLTEGRPNVYLEVGYAWGKGIPVIIVAKKGENLHFDVRTQRCIFYGRFTQFAKDLEELIRGIESYTGNIKPD